MEDPVDETVTKAEMFGTFAIIGKAFGSAKRLEIIDLLSQGERTVDSLAKAAELGVTTVSAHLQILKMANLVHTRRQGTSIHYRLAGDDVAALYAALGTVARERSADVAQARAAYLGVSGDGDVEEISRAELVRRRENDNVLLLDVRPSEEYAAGHIPGAVSVPFGSLPAHSHALPQEPDLVAYCRGAYCVMAHDAVRLLHSEGRQAQRLEEGMLEWRLAGLPVETGAAQ